MRVYPQKKLLGLVRSDPRSHNKKETKTKVLEASDLRAFYKYYIIINQQFINVNDELMYYFGPEIAG